VSGSTWFDGGILEVSTDNSTWTQVTPTPAYPGTVDINPSLGAGNCLLPNSFHVDGKPGWIGASAGWQQVTVPIPASSLTSTFRFRFAYSTGVSSNCTNAEACRTNAGLDGTLMTCRSPLHDRGELERPTTARGAQKGAETRTRLVSL